MELLENVFSAATEHIPAQRYALASSIWERRPQDVFVENLQSATLNLSAGLQPLVGLISGFL